MSQLSTFYPNPITAAELGVGAANNVTFGSIQNTPIGSTTASTGAFTSLSTAPAANAAALTTTGYSITGSNAQSLVSLTGAWNTTGTPSAFNLNITDTASNASSLLMQLQTGGTNRFTVSKGGAVVCASVNVGSGTLAVLSGDFFSNGFPVIRNAGTEVIALTANSNVGVNIRGNLSLGFNANANPTALDPDLRLWRDGADTLAQYRGTNSQEQRLYGTYSSASSYQRMTIKSVKQTLSALSGASATTTGTFIPDGAVVVGVTTRVATALTGAASYTIGDGTDADRWGDITGTAIGTTSDNANWTAGTIECFTAGREITLTAKTSNFTAGAIEICVFYLAGQAD